MARRAAAIPKATGSGTQAKPGTPTRLDMSAPPDTSAPPKANPEPKPKRVSRRTTPNPETLSELGLERLIGLVLDEVARNTAFKKLVTAAVASLQGPGAVAALIDRRLTALERAEGYIDWQKRRTFATDLDAMLTTVVTELGALDTGAALDRLIRFLAGAGDVLGRTDDSTGRIHGIYERAAAAAAALILDLTGPEAAAMALRLVERLETDGYGLVERLLHDLIAKLPASTLPALDAALAETLPPAAERDYRALAERRRLLRMRQALADRTGDVNAFIAFETERQPKAPNRIAIAERLLAAGRPKDALAWIRRSQKQVPDLTAESLLMGADPMDDLERQRLAVEIRILDALGETSAAQDLRWQVFEAHLDREMLRAYLAKLPDFEDDAALDEAFAVVDAAESPYAALAFYTHWPEPARAARLVLAHREAWEGHYYETLAPAADLLEQNHPLAATILYRHLVDSILEFGRSNAYGHGARYLGVLDHLAARLEPGAVKPSPEQYRAALRRDHGRKAAFWAQVPR